MKKVSITHTIYGSFDKKRLELVMTSLKRQNYANIEPVVAEANLKPSFKDPDFNYVFIKTDNVKPALIRNAAIVNATGDYVRSIPKNLW